MLPPTLLRIVLFSVLAASALTAQAQQGAEPFSTVELRLSGTANLNHTFLHEFWKRGTGVEASLATPFHFGFFELGSAIHRYEADGDVPGFGALWLYAGWGLRLDVADRLRLEGSARLGNYQMSFDEENRFTSVTNESELAMMLNARVAARVVGPVSVHLSGGYLQAYTFVRLKLWYASAGLGFRLQSPDWLKDLLQ